MPSSKIFVECQKLGVLLVESLLTEGAVCNIRLMSLRFSEIRNFDSRGWGIAGKEVVHGRNGS